MLPRVSDLSSSNCSSGLRLESRPLGTEASGQAPRLYTDIAWAPLNVVCPSIPCLAVHLVGLGGFFVQRLTGVEGDMDRHVGVAPCRALHLI